MSVSPCSSWRRLPCNFPLTPSCTPPRWDSFISCTPFFLFFMYLSSHHTSSTLLITYSLSSVRECTFLSLDFLQTYTCTINPLPMKLTRRVRPSSDAKTSHANAQGTLSMCCASDTFSNRQNKSVSCALPFSHPFFPCNALSFTSSGYGNARSETKKKVRVTHQED